MDEPEDDQPQDFRTSPNRRYTSVRYAPAYHIPSAPVIGIEHPCIIRNKDRGIQSLGGLSQLQKVVTLSHQQHTNSLKACSYMKADIQ